jgi:alpha-1,3-rhamnosyl/mannosyltransferase
VLLDALSAMDPSDSKRCPLVFAGLPGWGSEDFWQSLVEHPQADRALAAGYVSDRLAGLMLASAIAVLVPSTYEGFGLPVLEAMSAGTPVICSDIPVFHEVAGQAATFVGSDNVQGWAKAMTRAVHDDTWRHRASQIGLQQAGTFSWQMAARSHAELFSRICRGRGSKP